MKHILALISILLLFNVFSFSQAQLANHNPNDSVIIVYDTVYVTDTVYLPDSKNVKKIILSPSFGFNYPLNKYESVLDANLANINNNTKNSISANFNINLDYQYNNFIFGIGIKYYEIHQKISMSGGNYVHKATNYTKTDTISSYFQIINGIEEVYYVTEQRTYTQYDSLLYPSSYINKHKYISIPVSFGYIFSFSKLNLIARAELVANLNIPSSKNIALSSDYKLREIEIQNYRKVILSANIACEAGYSLYRNIDLFGKISFERYLQSVYKTDFIYSYKPLIFNTSVGIRYFFQKKQ